MHIQTLDTEGRTKSAFLINIVSNKIMEYNMPKHEIIYMNNKVFHANFKIVRLIFFLIFQFEYT